MRWNQVVATVVTAGAVSAASIVTAAVSAQAQPSGFGMFGTWKAAQAAAGFKLLRPTRTYGHVRNGLIGVTRCEVKKSTSKVVVASYGLTPFSTLALYQNNSGRPCSTMGKVKVLGKVKVDGTTGQLTGKCGMAGLRSCKSTKIFLFLTWKRHGTYYVASSFGQSSARLTGFAAGLHPLG
jgi:hypothetical protein